MNFEEWFKQQDFYANLRFIYGIHLFNKDDGIYRAQPVETAHKAWLSQENRVKNLEGLLWGEA